MNDHADPSAEPTTSASTTSHADELRTEAAEANRRAWTDTVSAPTAQALHGVIDALAPIASDREACVRVLEAARELFAPHATAPQRDFADILEEVLTGPVGQMGLPLLAQYLAAQQAPKQQVQAAPAKPCPCAKQTAPTAPARTDDGLWVVLEKSTDQFYVVTPDGVAGPQPRDGISPPAGAGMPKAQAEALASALRSRGVVVEILPWTA